jgi:hypothetical protein
MPFPTPLAFVAFFILFVAFFIVFAGAPFPAFAAFVAFFMAAGIWRRKAAGGARREVQASAINSLEQATASKCRLTGWLAGLTMQLFTWIYMDMDVHEFGRD